LPLGIRVTLVAKTRSDRWSPFWSSVWSDLSCQR